MPVPCDPFCPQTTLGLTNHIKTHIKRLNEEKLADSECYTKERDRKLK